MSLAIVSFYLSLAGLGIMLGRKVVATKRDAPGHPNPFSHALFAYGVERVLLPIENAAKLTAIRVHRGAARFHRALSRGGRDFIRDIPDDHERAKYRHGGHEEVVSFHLKRIAQQKRMVDADERAVV